LVQGGIHLPELFLTKLIHHHSLFPQLTKLSLLVNLQWPNQPPVHPSDGPIINHATTYILPPPTALARQSAQHRHFALVFVAAVEAEESSFARLAAFDDGAII